MPLFVREAIPFKRETSTQSASIRVRCARLSYLFAYIRFRSFCTALLLQDQLTRLLFPSYYVTAASWAAPIEVSADIWPVEHAISR
jgi:hypothetical protein